MHSILALWQVSLLATITAGKLLADGSSMQYGTASSVLQWQSSGVLYSGCTDVNIGDCYKLSLTSNATQQLDPNFPNSPRQRIEFRSETKPDGSTYKYTWKHHLSPSVGTTTSFFHLMQVFSIKDSGPVVTLDAVSGRATLKDYFRSCASTGCPSMDIGSFEDRLTLHTMTVTFGPRGKLYYVVSDANSRRTLLTYNVTGYMGSGGSYIKFGTYRQAVAGMTSSTAECGDFTIKQVSG